MDLSAFIEDVLDYIENHLESVLTHERLAKRFNVPKPYLQRLFSAVMGLSLKQYTLERKLNAAIYLIQSTDYTLKEIGAHLEISTPAAFSRAFKRQYSITPSSLRKSPHLLSTVGVPSVAGHFFKSLSDAGVTDFKLLQRAAFQVSGLVASVDISRPDDMLLLNGQFSQLLDALGWAPDSSGYILYSDGLPDQTV